MHSKPHPNYPGYWNSPWPAEDNGPERLQSTSGFELPAGAKLRLTHRRTQISTMVVLGDPGEVFLLTHDALRARLGLPTRSKVERIDPYTLKPICSSVRLPGGPMWPGGMAVHSNGRLIVVYGRYAHALTRQCELVASQKLPENEPYNSFVVLNNGYIVCKNLSRTRKARLSVLHPDTLQHVCEPILAPEPSIARLSAKGNTVYLAGLQHVYRFDWSEQAQTLSLDTDWQPDYLQGSDNTNGWDIVLTEDTAWLMDNGHHTYLYKMLGAGVSSHANAVIGIPLSNPQAVTRVQVSGKPKGSVTNPPLFCTHHKILLAYDSANAFLQAYKVGSEPSSKLALLWNKPAFGCASHMILMQSSNTVWINDYRKLGEEVVALDILTGKEKARIRTPGKMQGVVFPSIGWENDLYWSSMDQVCRIYLDS